MRDLKDPIGRICDAAQAVQEFGEDYWFYIACVAAITILFFIIRFIWS